MEELITAVGSGQFGLGAAKEERWRQAEENPWEEGMCQLLPERPQNLLLEPGPLVSALLSPACPR